MWFESLNLKTKLEEATPHRRKIRPGRTERGPEQNKFRFKSVTINGL